MHTKSSEQLVLFVCCCAIGLARLTSGAPLETTLEDPMEASAVTSLDGSSSSEQSDNDICTRRCYDKVAEAQKMIALQDNLKRQEKILIDCKNLEATSSSGGGANCNSGSANACCRLKNNKDTNSEGNQQSSTVRSRTLQASEPIVISRLRVARAASSASSSASASSSSSSSSQTKPSRNKIHLDLKRLKQRMQKQLNVTCNSVISVQECLSELTTECIGNLQFHSYEVYANQWHSKMNCPYKNNPGLRVFPGLRSTYIQEDAEQPRVPVPRRISSNEEVRSRLHEMFPNGFARPFGVMLRPHWPNSQATELRNAATMQQQQQLGGALQQHQQQQLRDFSGHFSTNQQQEISQQNSYEQVMNNDLHNVGRILLVPCCFAIMIAVVALASLYYWRPYMKMAPI